MCVCLVFHGVCVLTRIYCVRVCVCACSGIHREATDFAEQHGAVWVWVEWSHYILLLFHYIINNMNLVIESVVCNEREDDIGLV